MGEHRALTLLPRVSVCIPTIPPREKLLARALKSVHAQTYQPTEIIVELDETGEGAAPTRNRAWQRATSEFVAFLDDDDELLPPHLELCLRALQRTGADLAYSWFYLMGWDEATLSRPDPLATVYNGKLVHPLGVPFGPEQEAHYRKHAFIPITTVVRREMLVKSGGYPKPGTPAWPLNDCEDWGGHLRLLDAGARFVHVPARTWKCHLATTRSTAGRPWTETYSAGPT